jgi:hypothetical protein
MTKELEANEDNEHTGANDENAYPKLDSYVAGLETELDKEIAALDSDHDATREQASADNDLQEDDSSNDDSSDDEDDDSSDDKEPEDKDEDNDASMPRLRRNRTRTNRHLKGRDGDGSLPTI